MIKSKVAVSILVVSIISFLVGIIGGIIIGVKIEKNNSDNTPTKVVTPTTILERISDQSFLVTKSVISTESVTITIDQGSSWSNFWWGHKITAEGLIQTDIGVDLSKLVKEDIQVDNDNKVISINLPQAEIYNSSIEGPIEVSTRSGILKKLLSSNTNEDYNLALEELSSSAEETVDEDQELFENSQSSTLDILQSIFADTGYMLKELNE